MADSLPAGFSLDAPAQAAPPQAMQEGAATDLPAGFELDSEKYGSTGQQIKTGLEGAGEALSFGLSTKAETALGVKPEDIRGRREENPGSHLTGQLAGLGTGMLFGTGEAAILDAAGVGAAKIAGALLPEAYSIGKIGSAAAKVAAENALFQGGDEVAKMFVNQPGQTIDTAMADIGLASLIGGGLGLGFGVIPPLWKATVGGKVTEMLGALQKKAGGIEGQISTPVKEAIERVGIDIPPEIRAGLSDDPVVQQAFKTLEQSDTTKSGKALQQSYGKVRDDLATSLVASLGKDASHVNSLSELSKFEKGKAAADTLADEVAEIVDPVSDSFDKLKTEFKDTDLVPDRTDQVTRPGIPDPQNLTGVPSEVTENVKIAGTTSQLSEKIAQLAQEQGWMAADDTPIANLMSMVQRNLPRQKTLQDLTNFISRVGEKAEDLSPLGGSGSARRAGGMIKGILKDAEADIIATRLGEKGPELVQEFQATRAAFRDAAQMKEALQERIGVKGSTSGYAKAIREAATTDAEGLLRKLSANGDADMLKLLSERFPKTAEAVKQYHLDSLLKNAADKAKPGQMINAKALINGIEKMSPEMRAFALPAGAAERIRSVGTLLEQFEKAPHNFSNTARTVDKLMQHIPGTAVGMATMIAAHNPALALVMGGLTKLVAKDAPDAMRLSMLKFMGSNQPIEAGAFKAMTDVARATLRGEAAANRAARGVFKSGSKVLPKRDVSESDRRKLDKQLMAYKEEPSSMMGVGGQTAHYLPDHGAAIGETAARAVNYLNSLRPNLDKRMPLDTKPAENPVQKAAFNRALDIAESPLMVLDHVKEGTLLPQDLVTLQNVAPGLYERLRQKVTGEMVNHLSDDEPVPYKTKLGLALFLGQPLDSTMTPEGILAAQPKQQQAPQAPQAGPTRTTQGGLQKLAKMGAENASPGQMRQMGRAKHIS